MKIEITERGSRAYYKETINAMNQYRTILKNPEKAMRDYFRDFSLYVIIGIFVMMALLLLSLKWGFDWLMVAAMVIVLILILFGGLFLSNLNKILKSFLKDQRSTIITMDEQSIEMDRGDDKIVQKEWSKVAFAKSYKNSFILFPLSQDGALISLELKYRDDIMKFVSENNIALKVIE